MLDNKVISELNKILCPVHNKSAQSISLKNDVINMDCCCDVLSELISERSKSILLDNATNNILNELTDI